MGQTGQSHWGAKSLPLSKLLQRAEFAVLLPQSSTYKLVDARIVLTQKNDYGHKLPKRLTIGLFYKGSNAEQFALVEAKTLKGVSVKDNIGTIIAQGYLFSNWKVGSIRSLGQRHGTDFGMVSIGLPRDEHYNIMNSLAPKQAQP
jgi:hypothetical protein